MPLPQKLVMIVDGHIIDDRRFRRRLCGRLAAQAKSTNSRKIFLAPLSCFLALLDKNALKFLAY